MAKAARRLGAPAGPRLLGIGGAHVDRRGQVAADFVPGASNPGTMREEVGGGTFNALRTAVRRGLGGALHSVRGGDAAGEAVAAAIAAAGIADLSAVYLDRATPSYTALLDRHGEPLAALADMALYEIGFPRQMRRARLREAIAGAAGVLTDANLPAASLQTLGPLAQGKPLFAIAISPAKAPRLRPILPALTCLFLNRRETEALLDGAVSDLREALRALHALGLRRAVVTDGLKPIAALDDGRTFTLRPAPARHVRDATGAGDALAGATVAALLRGLPLPQALREGAAAAMLTVEAATAVAELDAAAFAEALALVPEPESLD